MKTTNILDAIQTQLDPTVFDDPAGELPKLKPDLARFVKSTIYAALEANGYDVPGSWCRLVLTGSLTTYQYSPESDFDVSLWVGPSMGFTRSDLIRVMIDHVDGKTVPGTTHPMQDFVVDWDTITSFDQLYQRGMRSAWDIDQGKWIVPPERDRVKDVQSLFPDAYHKAAMTADKLQELLNDHPLHAKRFWDKIHRQRHDDMLAGKGDFAESNIVYKYIFNKGMAPQISEATGEYLARRVAALENDRWIHKGRPFSFGVVNLQDGQIEEVHPYKRAEQSDFHHSLYISPEHDEGIREGTKDVFWMEDGEPTAMGSLPHHVRGQIKRQIERRTSHRVQGEVPSGHGQGRRRSEEGPPQGTRPADARVRRQAQGEEPPGDEEAGLRFPTLDDTVELHDALLDRHAPLVRHETLEGALSRAQNHYAYTGDIHMAAAALAHGVGMAQAFEDGNKRTAHALTHAFLEANGRPQDVGDDEELADHLIGHAEGTHTLEDTARLLKSRDRKESR